MAKTRFENQRPVFLSIKDTYLDFAENTSIHGIKYTALKDSNIYEKILWILIVSLGITGSIFMVGLFWQRYNSNPTRTSVETTYAPTTAIPFPAVTICNINKILTSKVNAFIKKLDLHGVDEEYLKSIFPQLLAYTVKSPYNVTDLSVLHNIMELNDFTSISRIIKRISQNCREMLVKCQWESRIIDCNKYFKDTYTPSGLCCSFNYNPKRTSENTTDFFGFQMGLTILLDPMVQEIQHSVLYSSGMRVIIHHPRNYPGFGNTEKILAVGRETLLQLDGTRYICSNEVRDLTPSQRKCVYSDEHKLHYFPVYTESNCVSECLEGYINNVCDCTPYYYTYTDKPICNISKIPCLAEDRSRRDGVISKSMHCDCPMQCEDIFYEVLSTSTEFRNTKALTSSFLDDVNTSESSMLLHIYFSKQTQTILFRDTITSTIYLLSSFGGIFSLFLGCSFISGAEIIYYVCIRFFINLKVPNKNETKLFKPANEMNVKSKNNLRFNRVSHGDFKGDDVYTIYGRNVFLN